MDFNQTHLQTIQNYVFRLVVEQFLNCSLHFRSKHAEIGFSGHQFGVADVQLLHGFPQLFRIVLGHNQWDIQCFARLGLLDKDLD